MTQPTAPDSTAGRVRLAIDLCRDGNWREALPMLDALTREDAGQGGLPGYFYSYLGHARSRCEGKRREGVELCRLAVRVQPFQPENHLNLAWALLLDRRRGQAYRALRTGLAFDPTHRDLVALARRMGVRSEPVLRFVDRGHALNRWLGRLRERLRAWRRPADPEDLGRAEI